jgi:hypothetical protein
MEDQALEAAARQLFLFGIPKERKADAEKYWSEIPANHVTKVRNMEAALLAVSAYEQEMRNG